MTASCRFCSAPLEHVFADLGMTPLANSFVEVDRANAMEPFYPLRTYACERCRLVQLEQFESPAAIFSDYAYFSSYSTSWLEHCRRYTEQMIELLDLGAQSRVVELASNDGYLLKHFRDAGIPVLGIEPAENVAAVANEQGIETLVEFFGVANATRLLERGGADLLLGNNVLAHVPDLNDFVAGMKVLLNPGGTITMEFPHLLRLIADRQWDTIYHEHFSYFSWLTVREVFTAHGLRLFDVEEIPTHGGSLRIYGAHAEDPREDTPRAAELLERERAAGLELTATYDAFAGEVAADKLEILSFLIALRREGRRVAGYGAPAKGNTMLNYCGIGPEIVEFTCDRSPHKQGRLLPGSHIPILAPEAIAQERPDVVLILPWNLREEVTEQLAFIGDWGGRFAARAPKLELLP
ncbi:MAG TPA: class I SAM-dependent methyltransferase [Solirubrobacteraceae bacterium]|nr:class I SAM-dependent methyltransferase [Solirubrobacteraceae bacterium]